MAPSVILERRHLAYCIFVFGALLCACGRSMENPQMPAAGVAATSASVKLVPTGDSVASSLTITNAGTSTQTVQFAPCTYLGPLSLRAYASGASKPAWESALDNNAPCFTATETVSLKAGAAHTFVQVNDVNEILGDSLASGSYMLTVSGRNLAPAVGTEIGNATLTLTKHTVAAPNYSFTTDSAVYSATGTGTAPFIQYSFTVIARYANTGATPITLLNACGPHPTWNIFGFGNNVGPSPYDPGSLCLVPGPSLIVSPGTASVDTIHFTGPTTTAADGTPFGPLYGQFVITYSAGAGCNTLAPPCARQTSSVFAVKLPQ
jgi:hypothetical protein